MNKKNITAILTFLVLELISFDAHGDMQFSKDFIEEAKKLGIDIEQNNQYPYPLDNSKNTKPSQPVTKPQAPETPQPSIPSTKPIASVPKAPKSEVSEVSPVPASTIESKVSETPKISISAPKSKMVELPKITPPTTKPKVQKVQKIQKPPSPKPKQKAKLKKENIIQQKPIKKTIPFKKEEYYFISPESRINNKDFDEKAYYKRRVYSYEEIPAEPLVKQDKKANSSQFMTYKELFRLLFIAVNEENIGGIKALLKKGVNINVQDKDNKYTPLMYAVKDAKIDALRYLLVKGANPNIKGINQMSALHLAAILNRLKPLRILLESGADINARDKYYKTFYDYVSKGYLNAVISDIYETRKNTNEALFDFCVLGSVSGVIYSLQNKADINAQNKDGDTGLILAVRYKNSRLVTYLLTIGADATIKNKYGNDASTIAKLNNYNEIHDIIETVKFNKQLYILGLTDSIISH